MNMCATIRRFPVAGLALALATVGAPALAQDSARGRALYETHCLTCHYERIHKREPSRSLVQSMADLRAEVAFRTRFTDQSLTPEDLEDIVQYLNRSHYRLKK